MSWQKGTKPEATKKKKAKRPDKEPERTPNGETKAAERADRPPANFIAKSRGAKVNNITLSSIYL